MPIPLTYPGVYVQELPNPVQPIVGVPTSVAAFYGQAPQGIVNYPFQVNSWADYENEFGSLSRDYPLSYAVYLFFLNGGTAALVVRYADPNQPTASAQLSTDITLEASSPGAWGNELSAIVDTHNLLDTSVNQFNLTINQTQGPTIVAQEIYPGASLIKGNAQYLPTLLAASQLVTPLPTNKWTVQPAPATVQFAPVSPAAPAAPAPTSGPQTAGAGATGADPAAAPTSSTTTASGTPSASTTPPIEPISIGDQGGKTGIYALTKADIFNILCLPYDPAINYNLDTMASNLDAAVTFCHDQRAMLIVDPPSSWSPPPATPPATPPPPPPPPLDFPTISGNPPLSPPSENAAVYYPNLVVTDDTGANFNVGPCGAVAGVWASTDSSRGVWKAPAGTAATITGITGFTAQVDDAESGTLNPLAVNGLRTMPAVGPVVWGARTTVGADQAQNQWKYLPVRRLALYVEESLRRGTQWAVFEPNDEPLWSSLRLNVTTFMQSLFRQGAFQGSTPADAYLVQCDANNNPQAQIDLGIVNILVGFAPLYPAEFVIINIQQQAGQS